MTITSKFIASQKIVLAKVEATYGTDSVPVVGTDAIEATEVTVNYPIEVLERDLMREDISQSQPISGKQLIQATITCEIKGSGAAGTAPAYGPLMKASGYQETISGGTSVTYAPRSSGFESCTVYVYEVNNTSGGNYKLHKLVGCVADYTINAEAGQIATITFNIMAKYTKPTDVSDPGTPTYQSTVPTMVSNASLTYNSINDLCISTVGINGGNEVIERSCVNDVTSIAGFAIVDRKPTATLNPETTLVAESDYYASITGDTTAAFSMGISGAAGNQATLTAAALSIDNITMGERNGFATDELNTHLNASSGDDELVIVFT